MLVSLNQKSWYWLKILFGKNIDFLCTNLILFEKISLRL